MLIGLTHHISAAKTAWKTLLSHWWLVYPLLLYQLVGDWVAARLVPAAMQQPNETLTLPLLAFGIVWLGLLAAFTAGWIGMACNRLQAYHQRSQHPPAMLTKDSDNIFTRKRDSQIPVDGPWQAFFDGVGRFTLPTLGMWLVLLLGLAGIGLWAHQHITASGGYPVALVNTLTTWLNTNPDATHADFQQMVMTTILEAPPTLREQLTVFSNTGSSALLVAASWGIINATGPACLWWQHPSPTEKPPTPSSLTLATCWSAWWLGVRYAIGNTLIMVLWLVLGIISVLASSLLAGILPWAAPLVWLGWLIGQTWLLLVVCELARHWCNVPETPPTDSASPGGPTKRIIIDA